MSRDDTTLLNSASDGPLTWSLLIAGDGGLRRIELDPTAVAIIGRDADCQVVLNHGSISKRHASIELGEKPTLRDLGSKNGTQIAGRRVQQSAPLTVGEVIEIGPYTLVLSRRPGDTSSSPVEDSPVVEDSAMTRVYELVESVAPSELSVIIVGETGTGKEVIASAVHAGSPRCGAPLIRLNCAALPLSLFEAELFGHEKGAFTGAVGAKRGLLDEASGGTLFLDELGEMPLDAQAKLLRAIEDRTFYRVGGRRPVQVDVRFVAATNLDLSQASQSGKFRADLYHRLNGITLRVPPLRDRPLEILPLAKKFAAEAAHSVGSSAAPPLSAETEAALKQHAWLGNVRELKNTMHRAVLLARGGVVMPEHLVLEGASEAQPPKRAVVAGAPAGATLPPPPGAENNADLRTQMQEFERERIVQALDACAGNQSRAAKALGISRRTLIARIESYGIARPTKGDG